MDWYLAGRILGVICWPLAAGALVYAVAWLLAVARPPAPAGGSRYWVHLSVGLAYAVTLFVTGLHLLRHLRLVG